MPVRFPPPYVGGYGRGSWVEGEKWQADFGGEIRALTQACGSEPADESLAFLWVRRHAA